MPRPVQWILGGAAVVSAYVYVTCWLHRTALGNVVYERLSWTDTDTLVLFAALFMAVGIIYGRVMGRRIGKAELLYLAYSAAAALWLLIYRDSGQDITGYVILFLHGAAVYWIMAMAGNRVSGCLDERALSDLLRGLFVIPFRNFVKLFDAAINFLSWLLQRWVRGKRICLQAVLGLCMSLPVLCIVVPLLMGADSGFSLVAGRLWSQLLVCLLEFNPVAFMVTWILTLLVSCYLFGMFFGVFDRPAPKAAARGELPRMMLGTFLSTFLILYACFFVVKLLGVRGDMEQIEAGRLLTSTYARDGFFELCWIALINFGILLFVRWYTPERSQGFSLMLTALGAQTLGFIALAFSKMWFYISSYGFTFKRVFTSWFMMVLFVTFVLLMAENWRRIHAIRVSVLFGCTTFLMLAYSNMPAWMGLMPVG